MNKKDILPLLSRGEEKSFHSHKCSYFVQSVSKPTGTIAVFVNSLLELAVLYSACIYEVIQQQNT